MAAGEYVSVGSQADAERADVALERKGLSADKNGEMEELAGIYVSRGIDPSLAKEVARQLMARDAIIGAHTRDELGISAMRPPRPIQAALTSAGAVAVGAAMPLLTAVISTRDESDPLRRRSLSAVPRPPGWVGCARRRRKRDERCATRNVLGCTGHGRDRRRRGPFRKGCVSRFRILL